MLVMGKCSSGLGRSAHHIGRVKTPSFLSRRIAFHPDTCPVNESWRGVSFLIWRAVARLQRAWRPPPRGAIRRRFEERFTARRMAREYLAVYRNLIEFEALRSRKSVARAFR